MPIRVTLPKPIASRPRAALPKMRASQISPAPPAMPTRAVSSPSQCDPPKRQTAAMAAEPIAAIAQNAVGLPAADEPGQGEPHCPPPAVPTVPSAGQERGAPATKAAQGEQEREAAGKAVQPRRPGVWGRQAEKIEERPFHSSRSGRRARATRGMRRRQQQAQQRARHGDRVGNRLLVDVDQRGRQHQRNQQQMREDLAVQDKRHEAAAGKACGQESRGDGFPPINRGETESEAQFDEHGPDPEAGAVQGRPRGAGRASRGSARGPTPAAAARGRRPPTRG